MEDKLYKAWQNAGKYYDLPDFDTFKEDMKDEGKLHRFHESLGKYYDVPDYDTFKADMGLSTAAQQSPTGQAGSGGAAAQGTGQPTVAAPQGTGVASAGEMVAQGAQPEQPAAVAPQQTTVQVKPGANQQQAAPVYNYTYFDESAIDPDEGELRMSMKPANWAYSERVNKSRGSHTKDNSPILRMSLDGDKLDVDAEREALAELKGMSDDEIYKYTNELYNLTWGSLTNEQRREAASRLAAAGYELHVRDLGLGHAGDVDRNTDEVQTNLQDPKYRKLYDQGQWADPVDALSKQYDRLFAEQATGGTMGQQQATKMANRVLRAANKDQMFTWALQEAERTGGDPYKIYENIYDRFHAAVKEKLGAYNTRGQAAGLLGDIDAMIAEKWRAAEEADRSRDFNFAQMLVDAENGGTRIADRLMDDPDMWALQYAKRTIQGVNNLIAEADHNAASGNFGAWLESSFAGGVARGFGQAVFDVRTWDMGFGDVRDATALMTALDKSDKGQPLTKAEQALLDAKAVELAANAYFKSQVGYGYEAGKVTGESLPFMLEMMINPASKTGGLAVNKLVRYALKRFPQRGVRAAERQAARVAERQAVRMAERRGMSTLGEKAANRILESAGLLIETAGKKTAAGKAVRAAVKTAGNVAGSAVMAGTTGLPGVIADTQNRMIGQLDYDTDEAGKAHVTGHGFGVPMIEAFKDALVARGIENVTEMSEFDVLSNWLGGLTRKTLDKLHMSDVYKFFDDIKMSDVAKVVQDFEKSTHWQGTFGEYLEEVEGGILNAWLVGDQTLDQNPDTGVFNVDNNVKTFLGVSLLGGAFSTVQTIGYRTPKARMRKDIEDADKQASELWGGTWEQFKNSVDGADDEEMEVLLANIVVNGNYSVEQRRAAAQYIKSVVAYRGAMKGEEIRAVSGESNPESEQSYEQGYQVQGEEREGITDELQQAEQRLIDMGFNMDSFEGWTSDKFERAIKDQDHGYSDEELSVIREYLRAKAASDGMQQRVEDDIDTQVQQASDLVDKQTNQGTGMVHRAVLNNGQEVYVTGGQLVMTGDGTMIDTEASDESLFVYNPATGQPEQYTPQDFQSVEDPINPDRLKSEAARDIRQTMLQKAEADMNGYVQQGGSYDMVDEQGNTMHGTVLELRPDNTAVVQVDGEQIPLAVQTQQLQAWVDNAKQKRMSVDNGAGQTGLPGRTGQAAAEGRGEAATQETAPVAPAPVESLPMDEKTGEPVWNETTPEQGYNHLMQSGLTGEDIGTMIDDRIAQADAAIEKASKGGTIDQRLQARQAKDYWENVKQLHEAAKTAAQQRPTGQAAATQQQAGTNGRGTTAAHGTAQPGTAAATTTPAGAPAGTVRVNANQAETMPVGDVAVNIDGTRAEDRGQLGIRREDTAYFLKTMSPRMMGLLDKVAKSLGWKIRLYNGENANERGHYLNGVIWVNRRAMTSKLAQWILGHEMTHGMGARTGGGETFKDYIKLANQLKRQEWGDAAYEQYIKDTIDAYKEHLKKLNMDTSQVDRAYIEEEIACDVTGDLLMNNPEMIGKLFSGVESPGRVQRIIDMIVDFLDYLKSKLPFRSAERRALDDLSKRLNNLYRDAKAQTDIAKATASEEGSRIESGEGERTGSSFSITGNAEGSGFTCSETVLEIWRVPQEDGTYKEEEHWVKKPLLDSEGNVVFRMNGREFSVNNPITVDDLKSNPDTALNYMLSDALRAGTIDEVKADQVRQQYADMLNLYLEKGVADENGNGFENLEKKWLWVGETVFRTVASNSDEQYSYSIDITKVCKKNEAVIRAISALQVKNGYGVTPAQILEIYEATDAEGFQVPCPVCYVFSRYINNGKYATAIVNGMQKYGKYLPGQPDAWPVEKWVEVMNAAKDQTDKMETALKHANEDVKIILQQIDTLCREITGGGLSAEEAESKRRHVLALDQRYRAALDVISQEAIPRWIKAFVIEGSDQGGWRLREDAALPEDMDDFISHALDIRKTASAMERYPSITRYRRAGGSAGGKEITFASNNELGTIIMGLGISKGNLDDYPNYYQLAAEAATDEERQAYLQKARERFDNARLYVQRQTLRGGQRMWSWSDNIESLSSDVASNLMQLELLGGALQTYSKQLEGVKMVAAMNGYVNASLMGYGDGIREVGPDDIIEVGPDKKRYLKRDILDVNNKGRERIIANGYDPDTRTGTPVYHNEADGKDYVLVFDDVVGIDPFGRDGKRGLFSLNEEYDRAGNILVGMNDIHVRAAMADPRVFFIIPWHASGMHNHILRQMFNILGVNMDRFVSTDYTNMQEETNFLQRTEKGKLKYTVSADVEAFWDSHSFEDEFACGTGHIENGDHQGGLSESQLHYRELRDAIFDGTIDNEDKKDWKDQVEADEFLSQVYRQVTTHVADGKMTEKDKEFIYPYEYWDETSTVNNADVNGRRYLEYCRRMGFKPKFTGKYDKKAGTLSPEGNFADDPGYWKLLIDRRMYDRRGNYQGLTAVDSSGLDSSMYDPDQTQEEFNVTEVATNEGAEKIADMVNQRDTERTGTSPAPNLDMEMDQAVAKYNEVTALQASLIKAEKKALEAVEKAKQRLEKAREKEAADVDGRKAKSVARAKESARKAMEVAREKAREVDEIAGQLGTVRDNIAQYPDNTEAPRFSIEARTLMGMHNISAEKLRSAIGLGGLANPSMAVVDTEVGGFTNFGEISLIPSADMIASRTGGNAGTWGADAYSPRFPETHRRLGKGGDKKLSQWVKSLTQQGMRQEMVYNTEEQFNDYYNGFNIRDNALVYPFLHEKGLSGDVDYYTHMNVDQRLEDDLREVNGDQWALLKRFDEDEEYKKKLTDIVVGDEVGKIRKKEGETFQEFRDRRREWAKQIREGLTGEDGYINRNLADDLLYAQARAYRENGKFSESRTIDNAEKYIRDHGMEEEYKSYFEQKMQELGAEMQVYAGSDSMGRSRYKAVSLDHVSRMMKKQGRAGGEGGIFADSPGAIRAKLLTPMKTLDQIRAKKDRLVSHEAFEQFRERYQEELRDYADAYASGSMGALADIITSSNMVVTAKRYNIDLDADAVAELNEFKKRVRALPTEYFETKFERPVMLDEFKKAVVPDDLSSDLRQALENAGLDVVDYPAGDKAARERVTLDAVKNDDSIRFSLGTGAGAEIGEAGVRFSIRTKPAPKKTRKAYKLMRLVDGKLYPLFIGNNEEMKLHTWYDADSPALDMLTSLEPGDHLLNMETGETMTWDEYAEQHVPKGKNGKPKRGKPNVDDIHWANENGLRFMHIEDKTGSRSENDARKKYGDTRLYYNWGINGSKDSENGEGSASLYALRPGLHTGAVCSMPQIGYDNPDGGTMRLDNQVWVEVEMADDVDYQSEAESNASRDIPTHIPVDGNYRYATNPTQKKSKSGDTETDKQKGDWYVTGAMKITKILSDEEADEVVRKYNKKYGTNIPLDYRRRGGRVFNAETMQLEEPVQSTGTGDQRRFSISETRTDEDGREVYTERRNDGTLDREVVTNQDGSKTVTWFDEDGNRKEVLDYYPNGEVRRVRNFNEYGNMTRAMEYDEDRRQTRHWEPSIGTDWKRDENGVARGRSNGVEMVRYSLSEEDYSKAVESGDQKKVAKMVRDAVKAAMPNTKAVDRWGKPRLLYHGTPQENQFYEFNGTIYLSSNRSVAGEYTHYRRTFGANPRQTGRIMPVFVNLENPLEIDANRHLWRNIDVDWSDTPVTTRDIEQYAKQNGYDGVIIKRVRDNMYDNDTTAADVYIAFSPEQVKSAGPTYEQKKRSHFPWDDYMELDGEVGATYDDEGNLIPLSQRFDMGKRDIRYSLDAAVAEAEQMTETNPTDGQKESGNYRKGHVKVDGFDISIEQPKGSVRSGVDADGNEWSQEMHNTYGYIRGTEGVDGDHIDVFLSDHLDGWNGNVYVVDQVNKDRSFDEHKVMYGFNSEQEAREAYLSNYKEGWTGLGNITGVSREEFKKWVDSSHRKNKPFAEYKNVKPLQSTGTGDRARFSLAPTFYSNAAKAVENVKQNKATAEQWKAMLTKQGGIKAGEDKWMGLSTWLDEHKGETLTKDEVRQFVAENGIEMEETYYGEKTGPIELFDSPNSTNEMLVDGHPEYKVTIDGWSHECTITKNGDVIGTVAVATSSDADKVRNIIAADLGVTMPDKDIRLIDQTRLNYTTNGLENKREIAFVVPGVEPYQEHDDIHFGPENQGRAVMWVRFGETTDTEGNRVLVIDEVQSNRHQDAREKGYKEENKYKAYRSADGLRWLIYDENDKKVGSIHSNQADNAEDAAKQWGVPAAPFEKNWHEVAMKRMLRLAAEEGFDKVAWTTGEQQASRYDLGSSVDFIEVNNHVIDGRTVYIRHTNGNQTEFTVDENGNIQDVLSHLQIAEGTPLSELVGKELADKIMQADNAKFEGKDLFVGGKGMRAFYDQMLPQFMNKYGKRWGVKVGEVTLDTPGGETMHSVDVNEDMKRSVMQGQPLFSLSLGAPYQGSKGQIATRVVDALPSGRRFVDLFAGGGAATHAAMLSGKYGEYRMNDINPAGLELFLKGVNGDYRDYIPRELTPDEFKAIKGTAEGLLLSYSGYGRNVDNDKESVARRLRRVQRLELLKPYADQVESSNSDYRDVELEPGDVVYADIPYEGTNKTGYREGARFDKQAFSDWGLAQDVPVYVSEQSMPEGWVEVASWNMKAMRGKTRGEKLFVQEKFAGDGGRGGAATRGTERAGGSQYIDMDGIRFSLVGEQGAGRLDALDEGRRIQDKAVAEEMERAGKDAKTIKLATGWERGADNHWRYEMPDVSSKAFKLSTASTLADIVDMNGLDDAYPVLKEYTVSFKGVSRGYVGDVDHETKEIRMSKTYNTEKVGRGEYVLDDYGMSTIIHEIQHVIQDEEGFAKGTNSLRESIDAFREYKDKVSPELYYFADKLVYKNSAKRLIDFGNHKLAAKLKQTFPDPESSQYQIGEYIDKMDYWEYSSFVRKAADMMSYAKKEGPKRYHNSAGEVEARNAEKRRKMSEEERRGSLAEETEDVPRSEQIVRYSLSTEEREAQTHSENFKRWFGDWENDPENASKVVDDQGRPLVVTHWTDREFYEFDRDRLGENTDFNATDEDFAKTAHIGFWFNEGGNSETFRNAYGENARQIQSYLDIKNPKEYGSMSELVAELGNYETAEDFVADSKSKGFDGIVVNDEEFGGRSYVTFDPEQIKSATDNNGEFSRENPDIRFSISEESQKIFDTAKRKFGETKDIREAGYVLPDGTMLDFSGRHELDPGTDSRFLAGRRTTDHRAVNEISFVYDENGDEVDTGVNSDMPDFIKRGAIRIDNNAGLINLSTAPTSAQKKVLRQLIAENGGDVQVDFGDGWDSDHYVEYDQAKPTRVLGDIDRYFDEGIKPQSNARFSLSGDGTVEEYNKAVNMTGRTVKVLGRERKPGLTRYNFQEAFQDSILAVKKLQQVVERHFGIKLPTRENAWMYENRLSSINMQERKSFIDKVYEPMMKIADAIMKRGVKEKELNAYLICKHGLERNQVFAARDAQAEADEIARNGGTPDMQQLIDKYRQRDYSGLTGVTGIEGDIADIEAEAQRIVDEFEQRHGQLCNELWDAIRKATQWSLRKSYQSGMMSAATFDHVRNMFQYYVPLRGWSETTAEDVYSYMMGEHGAFNGVLKKAEGRTSVADDPLATIGNMAESALMQGNRNLLKQHLLRMAQNHPTDVCQVRDVWLVEGPGGVWEPHWPNIPEDATPDEIDQILQDHEADMLQLEAGGSAKRVRNNLDIPYRIDARHVPEHAVVAKVAGIDHVVYINGNPRAAQAMNGQTGAAQGKKSGFTRWIDFIFGDLKRYYSSVLTSLNINFSGANFVRDLPHAYAMTFSKYGPLKAAQYIAKSFQVIPWVFKNQLGKTGTSQMDRYFQEFLSSGSVTGYAHINDVDAWKADNKRRWARLSALGKAQVAVPRALGEVINAIGWFSETLELIPRFTAFLVERQAGKDIATATKAAKDITTNFNKKGSEVTPGVWGAVANTLRYMKMFFNPIVQGMYQFVDVASTGKENKWVGPRLALATMHLPVLGAIVPYLNQFLLEALGGDDDDDYWLLNEYTRRNNVCIFTGNGYVKIPIAPVFRELYGMGEVVATRHYGKADNEKTAIDLIDQLRTMGSVEGQSSYNEWSLARFLLPEHFAPFIDVMNNENFTGGPIYYDNHYKEFAPEYTKAKKSTWSPMVAASKWLNEMMGGDEDIAAGNSGKWMNPAVWQHVITNVGGGFAQLAGDVVSGVTDIAEGKEIDASNIPVAKRFYSGSSEERAQWARFGIYKDYEKEYTMAKEKYQALDKRGLSLTERAAEVAKFAESHPKAAAIYAVWEGGIKGADIPQQLSKLGKDDPKYWDLVKEAVGKAEKAMNSGYVRAWEQKRKDRPDSMSDKELDSRFDKSDNDSIRHIMADEIAKRAGSQDYYGREAQATWSDKSVAAWEAYQGQRTSDDIKADVELSNLLKVDEGEKDKARIKMLGYIKDELNKIRRGKDATSRSAGVKGLGEGDDERVMEELRAARKQLIEDLKNGSAEQAYRNLERRTMRLGLRKKAKEL